MRGRWRGPRQIKAGCLGGRKEKGKEVEGAVGGGAGRKGKREERHGEMRCPLQVLVGLPPPFLFSLQDKMYKME